MAAARCSCGIGLLGSPDPGRGFKKGDLKFMLDGEKLHGSWVLVACGMTATAANAPTGS